MFFNRETKPQKSRETENKQYIYRERNQKKKVSVFHYGSCGLIQVGHFRRRRANEWGGNGYKMGVKVRQTEEGGGREEEEEERVMEI